MTKYCDRCKMVQGKDHDPEHKVFCIKGGEVLLSVPTAYGERATCHEHKVRMTRCHDEDEWVAEFYSPMVDNAGGDHAGS